MACRLIMVMVLGDAVALTGYAELMMMLMMTGLFTC